MRYILASLCIALLFIGNAVAAPDFPALTGRVVDGASILSLSAKRQLEQALINYESNTSTQVVVATIPSLEGLPIEDYGVQLGRHWQIGQKDKDNGILLIVAPGEREVRIEVGYGLEGVMTDALASQIITSTILPHFREGRLEEGVVRGAEAILNVLGENKNAPIVLSESIAGDYPFFPELPPLNGWHIFGLIMGLCAFIGLCIRYPKIFWVLLAGFVYVLKNARTSSGSSSSGSRRSGGGGGSFGGGGSSGKW